MKYKDALETVEQWLDKKHIRQFCRTSCSGRCCIPHEHHCKQRCERPPLLCAMYLCDELRKILFGFHNGEKYYDISSKINKITADAGFDPMKITDMGINLNIPNKLITQLISLDYEEDIHWNNKFIRRRIF